MYPVADLAHEAYAGNKLFKLVQGLPQQRFAIELQLTGQLQVACNNFSEQRLVRALRRLLQQLLQLRRYPADRGMHNQGPEAFFKPLPDQVMNDRPAGRGRDAGAAELEYGPPDRLIRIHQKIYL